MIKWLDPATLSLPPATSFELPAPSFPPGTLPPVPPPSPPQTAQVPFRLTSTNLPTYEMVHLHLPDSWEH